MVHGSLGHLSVIGHGDDERERERGSAKVIGKVIRERGSGRVKGKLE